MDSSESALHRMQCWDIHQVLPNELKRSYPASVRSKQADMESALQKTVLIVDDEERNRRLLEVFASSDGYRTLIATNGKQGLLLAMKERPDVVLLDLMMPEMDGFEVARRLKAEPETAGIPVIVVSSLDDAASRGRMRECGIDRILGKPIDRWKLSRSIAELTQGVPGQ